MTKYERMTYELGSAAVYREFVAQVRAAGGGLIEPPLGNRLWPAEDWTESQRLGFAKCLADTADLFPPEVRSTIAVGEVLDESVSDS